MLFHQLTDTTLEALTNVSAFRVVALNILLKWFERVLDILRPPPACLGGEF